MLTNKITRTHQYEICCNLLITKSIHKFVCLFHTNIQSQKQKHPKVHNELKSIGKTLKIHKFSQN